MSQRWATKLSRRKEDAAHRRIRFERARASLTRLRVDGDQVFDLTKQSKGTIRAGRWHLRDRLDLEFDLVDHPSDQLDIEIEWVGERLRRRAIEVTARAAKANARATDRATADAAGTSTAEKLAARQSRIETAMAAGAPLSSERLAMCRFDARTHPHMPGANRLLDPAVGPQPALAARAKRRGRQAKLPPPDQELIRQVKTLAPIVQKAMFEAVQTGFGIRKFDPDHAAHFNLLTQVFFRFANGDLGEPGEPEALHDGVPDSANFFCLAEFAAIAATDGPIKQRPFWTACYRMLVRATRIYYRAYSQPSGMRWQDFRLRRYVRQWHEVEADLAATFRGHRTWPDAAWTAKHDEVLAACCIGNSGKREVSDAELARACGTTRQSAGRPSGTQTKKGDAAGSGAESRSAEQDE